MGGNETKTMRTKGKLLEFKRPSTLLTLGFVAFVSTLMQQLSLSPYGERTNQSVEPVESVVVGRNFTEHSALVAWRKYNYRVPTNFPFGNETFLVTGVLSTTSRPSRRQTVRETWGNSEPVFFLVGGKNFSEVEEEFNLYQDLIWVNHTEHYFEIVIKVAAFFHAVSIYFPNSYALKTDDDVYVQVSRVREVVKNLQETGESEPHYVGEQCTAHPIGRRHEKGVTEREFIRNVLPAYNFGWAYLISSWFNECLVQAMADKSHMKAEDVFFGILAERCRIPCTKVKNWSSQGVQSPPTKVIATHLGRQEFDEPTLERTLRQLQVCNENMTHPCTVEIPKSKANEQAAINRQRQKDMAAKLQQQREAAAKAQRQREAAAKAQQQREAAAKAQQQQEEARRTNEEAARKQREEAAQAETKQAEERVQKEKTAIDQKENTALEEKENTPLEQKEKTVETDNSQNVTKVNATPNEGGRIAGKAAKASPNNMTVVAVQHKNVADDQQNPPSAEESAVTVPVGNGNASHIDDQ